MATLASYNLQCLSYIKKAGECQVYLRVRFALYIQPQPDRSPWIPNLWPHKTDIPRGILRR